MEYTAAVITVSDKICRGEGVDTGGPAVCAMLRRGCEQAREVAAQTLSDVRRAMKINYFDDADLIKEQAARFAQK